jgi:hypothetical protein
MKYSILKKQVKILSTIILIFAFLVDNLQNVALPGRIMEIQMHSGHVIQLKFCQTCKIFRPPRVSHCSLCNACIGKKNHCKKKENNNLNYFLANFDHHW